MAGVADEWLRFLFFWGIDSVELEGYYGNHVGIGRGTKLR